MLASAVLGLCARVVVAPTAMSDFRPTACYALYCVRPSRLRPSRGRCYSVTTLHSPSSEAHAAAETYAVFVLSCADLGAAYGTAKAGVGIASMGEYKVFLLSSIPALSRSSANVALEMKQDFPIAAAHPLMVVNLDFWLVRRTGGRYLELLATCVHTNVSDGVAIRCNFTSIQAVLSMPELSWQLLPCFLARAGCRHQLVPWNLQLSPTFQSKT